jgi:2-amino-4-hydroxy-6-hydroxymethyldihydropteridine diphosphokinase
MKMKTNIYLSLGSNLGKRMGNIISALSFLQSSGFVNIRKISSFYETTPVGPKQKNFYNVVVKAQTDLSPCNLLLLVKQAEQILGRRKALRWHSRVIDIDILFFGQKIIEENIDNFKYLPLLTICESFNLSHVDRVKAQTCSMMCRNKSDCATKKYTYANSIVNLTIPHREIQNRLFVLVPLCEIEKDFIHPALKQKISSILRKRLLTLGHQKIRIVGYDKGM